MMARRQCPRPTRRSGETQTPAPSGPRCAIVSRMRMMEPVSIGRDVLPICRAPTIPHIPGQVPREPLVSDLAFPAPLIQAGGATSPLHLGVLPNYHAEL